MGYTMGNYALGYYSDPDEVLAVNDILPPELALGRKPRDKNGYGHLIEESIAAQ